MTIRVERQGPVRTVLLDRPEKRNAISRAMFDELIELFSAEPEEGERVTVLRSTGNVFSSGIDLNERLQFGAPPLEEACEAIRHYALPVVGIVQGDAIAGGAFLAVACDFVVAADTASIWFSLVQIGLAPPFELSDGVRQLAGPALARRLLLHGDRVPFSVLAQHGVIAAAVPAGALEAEAGKIVSRLSTNAPASLRAIKATLTTDGDPAARDRAKTLIATARDSQDGRTGVQARLDGALPEYR